MNKLKNWVLVLSLFLLPACGVVSGERTTDDAATADGRTDVATTDGKTDAAPTDAASPEALAVKVDDANAEPDRAPVDDAKLGPDHAPVDDANAGPDAPKADAGSNDASNVEAGDSGDSGNDVCGQARVALGAAASFAVLAGSTVTNTGLTVVTGDLGVSPGTAVTGFPPGTLVGAEHAGDPRAAEGKADLTTAYNDAAGRTLCPVAVAGNLGGQTLRPGLYRSTSSLAISSGDLTLDAGGDGDAVFIFQMASTLTATSGRQVILSGSARASNIFWQVGSAATLGSTTVFAGTILADQAITLQTGATLNGRALARTAAVSMDTNTVVKPVP